MNARAIFLSCVAATALASAGAQAEQPPSSPKISAQAWMLMDYDSGHVITAHRAEKRLHPGGLSQLALTYLAFERLRDGAIKPTDTVMVSTHAADTPGTKMFLRAGEEVSVEHLLKGLIVLSANDAAVALAEYLADSEAQCVTLLNALARKLRLTSTEFHDVTGLGANPGNQSSARDLARLAAAIVRDFPQYYSWFSLKELTHNEIRQYNRNALLWRDVSFDGIKAAQSRDAGFGFLATARRGDMRLIAAVLAAPNENARVLAAQTLLDYGFRHYETRRLYRARTPITRVRVWMGSSSSVALGIPVDAFVTLPRGWHDRLRATVTVKEEQTAPIRVGKPIGALTLELDGDPIAEYPLIALKDVRRGNVFQRVMDRLQRWLTR